MGLLVAEFLYKTWYILVYLYTYILVGNIGSNEVQLNLHSGIMNLKPITNYSIGVKLLYVVKIKYLESLKTKVYRSMFSKFKCK